MICIFIALFAMVIAVNMFYVSYQLCGINRIFINPPIALIESSVNMISNGDQPNLYFNKEDLIEKLTSYYDEKIEKLHVEDYTLTFTFVNPSNESYCTTSQCQGFKMKLKSELTFNLKYEREVYYKIQKN